MSRLEEVKESAIKRISEELGAGFMRGITYPTNWILQDISETLAMIYDKMTDNVSPLKKMGLKKNEN